MKKLITSLAVIAMAVAVNAATISWTMTNVNKDGVGVNGLAFLLVDSNISRDSVLALAGQGADAFASALSAESAYAQAWTVESGKATTFTTSDRIENSAANLENMKAYNFYAVVFDTDTITDESNFYVTALKNVVTADGTSNKVIGFGTQLTPSAAEGAWNAVAVPEPTSGLLMLVGLAGLALRRRRA